ncbi:enoyl-CoA hydratase/isomerase family protein [Azorhizophilus paspali]|uniref:Enoyl-CoA hydratase/isomerase family protein n=1 Tax=Azorhizophilus paspali TaxID=69963 RepID=A0ABV6SHE7_AZOPA
MSGGIPSLDICGPLATLRLRWPDKANRLGEADLSALLECLARVEAAAQVRVLLRAEGRHFCAGYSFDDLATAGDGERFEAMADTLENLRPLTVAEVQGAVFGGATDILLACDFCLGGPAAQMLMPAARFGLHLYAYAGLFRRYVSRLGLNAAKRLILACEKLDARGMLEVGLLTHVRQPRTAGRGDRGAGCGTDGTRFAGAGQDEASPERGRRRQPGSRGGGGGRAALRGFGGFPRRSAGAQGKASAALRGALSLLAAEPCPHAIRWTRSPAAFSRSVAADSRASMREAARRHPLCNIRQCFSSEKIVFITT